MMTPIVFFLVATVCSEDKGCKNIKIQSYPTGHDCMYVADGLRKLDDTIWTTCVPSKAKHDKGAD